MLTGRYTYPTGSGPLTEADLSRRGLIVAGTALGGLLLSGCDRLSQAPQALKFIDKAEGLTRGAQRLILSGQPLAHEFKAADISPVFKANGSFTPTDPAYLAMQQNGFADWRLSLSGLVRGRCP